MDLHNKVAVITGGARGLGRAFSEALLSKGAKISICDINVADGEATLQVWREKYGEGRTMFKQCDVSNKQSFTDVFVETKRKFGRIDIVVNNAGIGKELFEQDWEKTIHVNLIGVIIGTDLAVQYMSKSSGGYGGVVINIASTAGLTPVFYSPVYCASKYGVVGFTRSVAANPNVCDLGMRFLCLCPAYTDTGLFQAGHSGRKEVPNLDKISQLVKSTGINSVESVANAFMELVENENNNGAVMAVSMKKGIEYKHGRPVQKSRI